MTHKSVYGKLQSVDTPQNSVVMKSDAGESLAWRFEAAVIAEVARFKPGDPIIVIYRQISPSEKRVTAVAFPGAATTPVYVNLTGSRVVLRSAPMVGGTCGQPNVGPISESTIRWGSGRVDGALLVLRPLGRGLHPGKQDGPRQGPARAVLRVAVASFDLRCRVVSRGRPGP